VGAVLHFGAADPLRCRFATSPLWETLAAVRALREPPGRRYHAPWLAGLDVAHAQHTFAPLLALQPRVGDTPDFLAPPPLGPETAIEAELARVRATPPDLVAAELARSLQGRGESASALGTELLAAPAATRDRLADLEQQAWELLVAPWWPRLSALLAADVAHRAGRLAAAGLGEVLSDLHPQVRWSPGRLEVGHGGGGGGGAEGGQERELGGAGLILVPSAFSWPSVCVLTDRPWAPMLVYPVRGVAALWDAPVPPPAALARLLGRGRAQVLAALGALGGGGTTTGLAETLGLSPATVSEHLSALAGGGLVEHRRTGRSVRYTPTGLGVALLGATA